MLHKFWTVVQTVDRKAMDGQRPSWYRAVAYERPERRELVLAPIPLNIVIGWWVTRVLPWLFSGHYNRRLEVVREKAYKDGYVQGYHDGLSAGINARPWN